MAHDARVKARRAAAAAEASPQKSAAKWGGYWITPQAMRSPAAPAGSLL